MKTITAIPVLLVIAVVGIAFAEDPELEEIKANMKVNNEKMGEMLDNILVDEKWDETATDAAVLEQHAREIKALDAAKYTKGMPKPEYFQAYALYLESSSRNLRLVAEEIQSEQVAGGKRSTHLRPNAAVFFGQAVSMCTNCHNQFRSSK